MASKGNIPQKYKPFKRYGHSLPTVKDKIYLWTGGMREMPAVHVSGEKEAFMSKVDIFGLKSGKWESHHTRGASHSATSYCASAVIDNDIYYFGGQCSHGKCFYNSVTKFSPSELKWREVRTNPIGAPMKKYSCGMVAFKDGQEKYLFVFGGFGELEEADRQPNALYVESGNARMFRTNEQHILDISKGQWIRPVVNGDCPQPCSGFTLTLIGENKAVLFGGYCSGKGRNNFVYIAELTKDSVTWTKLAQPDGAPWPKERCDHATCVIMGHANRQPYPILVIAGGIDDGTILSDCWLLNTVAGTWTQVNAPENEVGRALMSMSIMNIGTQYVWLILFGGAKTWERGKSTKEQGICSDTAVIELCWAPDTGEWKFVSSMSDSAVYSDYQHNLKERLLERRRSMGFDN